MTFDEEYSERVNAWGRRVAKQARMSISEDETFTLETSGGSGGGCVTCGYGADDGGFELRTSRGLLVEKYEFYQLGMVMRELWGE